MAKLDQPILFCFCGPAACGKSTICQELIKRSPTLKLSISTTTREPRKGEQDGVHYYFVDQSEFKRRLERGAFLEHAEFGGHYYGTEMKNVEDARGAGADLLLDIDVQGVVQLKKLCGDSLVTVFVFPPSIDVLIDRFKNRGTDSDERIKRRLEIAEGEIERLSEPGFSDYLLLNDVLQDGIANAEAIICAERQRFSRLSCEALSSIFQLK